MTTRFSFVSALRLLRRQPPSALYRRSFSASRRLKDDDAEGKFASPKEGDYDYRKPCLATDRRNFPAHIRHLMRSAPNALTVITSCPFPEQYHDEPPAATPASETERVEQPRLAFEEGEHSIDRLPEVAGLLVSSFNTVTLTPTTHVSFNIKLPSITYATMRYSNGFTASGVQNARVAHAFVSRKHPLTQPSIGNIWQDLVESDGRLRPGTGGTWWMRCRLVQGKCVEVGDHMIIVGEVVECGGYEGGEGMIGSIYADGRYRKVGAAVGPKLDKELTFQRLPLPPTQESNSSLPP